VDLINLKEMSMFSQRAIEALKKEGFKITKPRKWIVEFLENNTSHPSAVEIYEQLRSKDKSFSFATVYNTLDVLVKSGIVRQISTDPKCSRFDPDLSNHGHFYCNKCGAVYDIFDIDINFNELKGKVEEYQLNLFGICEKCLKGGN
jgi:Fur family peroxide stress response transcriptional regulator